MAVGAGLDELSSSRYQSRSEWREQLDDGVGDTFASGGPLAVDLVAGSNTNVSPTPSSDCAALRGLAE